MSWERQRLEERRDLVRRDLTELAVQEETGEIDPETAERLRRTYQSELAELDAAAGELGAEAPERSDGGQSDPSDGGQSDLEPEKPRWSRRRLVGSVLVIGALVVAVAAAALSIERDDDGQVGVSPGELSVDPATVSNEELEAVVAANPTLIPMRMALADRYFAAEEYGDALDHYLVVADSATTPADEAKALARIGWIAYRTGLAEAADRYVRTSLEVDPGNAEAMLYTGFITFYGLGDAEGAIPLLEAALEIPNLSSNTVSQVEDALGEARAGD
jgi:tetratricopeptide (TPR) repeat protein